MNKKRVPWIILMTHDSAGSALMKSAEMIMGELEEVHCLALHEGQDPMEYVSELKKILEDAPNDTIILTDLFGGTPSNSAATFALQQKYQVISGLNLAMLVEAKMSRRVVEGDELVNRIIQAGKDGIRNIRQIMNERMEV